MEYLGKFFCPLQLLEIQAILWPGSAGMMLSKFYFAISFPSLYSGNTLATSGVRQ